MILRYPRATPHGDTGVAIEFGDRIDEAINASVLALDRLVADNPIQGMIEAVPTYRSLMIHYDPVETSFERISTDVLTLARSVQHVIAVDRLLTIPVCYGGEFGIDLDSVAAALSVDADEVVRRHSAQTYRVYMLGFQPGFAYLGGLDQGLQLPRRAQHRQSAPAGTISIAAEQCAVHAVEGPSGWHWIGRNPMRGLHRSSEAGFEIEPGDRIKFVPVTPGRWHELHRRALSGQSVIEYANHA
jgi:5-oxoprolinase (ATP-hydrolysing) subunit B